MNCTDGTSTSRHITEKKKNQMHTIIYAKRTCQRCAQQGIQQNNRLIADAATALQIQIQDAR